MDNKKPTSIALGQKEKTLGDAYRKKFWVSRSADSRLIINDFFLKNKESKY